MRSQLNTRNVPGLRKCQARNQNLEGQAIPHKRERERMKYRIVTAAAALISVLPLLAQTDKAPQNVHHQPPAAPVQTASPDRGQQVFEQNCSRCHNPPQGFSPQISGTIALHMRVRANLSDSDYKALRHFLNP
jgi:cytochrome c5